MKKFLASKKLENRLKKIENWIDKIQKFIDRRNIFIKFFIMCFILPMIFFGIPSLTVFTFDYFTSQENWKYDISEVYVSYDSIYYFNSDNSLFTGRIITEDNERQYIDGALRAQYDFDDDGPHRFGHGHISRWRLWHENKNLKSDVNWFEDYQISYFRNGNKSKVGVGYRGFKDISSEFYFNNGQIKSRIISGLTQEWDSTGVLINEIRD